ncbi:MAG: uracil-DNA glycosylase [Dehalococcoidia bacterium]|nr:uracil-DNA glycosylase [Dehalococcoidia bacterium]
MVRTCRACALGSLRTNAVPGEGNAEAEVMFVGEAPGYYEDQAGRPFVGQAGKLLDDLLARAGLSRLDVFIANVLKCRPPGNRDPLPGEMDACSAHLNAQVDAIDPRVIVTLGRYSMQRFLPGSTISRVHGQRFERDGRIVVPMYHPAAALHQGSLRAVIEADFAKLPEYMRTPVKAPEPAPQPAEQGRLF